VCYQGDGWTVEEKQPFPLKVRDKRHVSMAKLVLGRGRETLLCLYTFKTGNFYTENYYLHQFHMMLNQLARRTTGAALVRITTLLRENEEPDEAVKRMREFSEEAVPHIVRCLP